MKTGQGEIIQERPTIARLYDHRSVRIGLQVLLIIGFSALTAVAKKIHPSMSIPGSSAVYWLTAMVIGRTVTKWPGSAMLTGMGVAVWGIPIGLEHTFLYDFALYGISGLMLDAMLFIPKISLQNPLGAMLCGFAAHMVKYGFIVYAALTSAATRHFLFVGLLNSALLHAAFGIAAGLLAWVLFKTGRGVYRRLS